MEDLKKQRALRLLETINNLGDESIYIDNKRNRLELISLYKQVTSFFNVRVSSDNLPKMLSKDVSETCSRCVRKEAMKGYIRSAISEIDNYKKILLKDTKEIPQDTKLSIHELRPTNDSKI